MAESYLLLSGLAFHGEKESVTGREYDTFIEGAGYQYITPCEMLECSATVLMIIDSNSNFMPSTTLGIAYNVAYNVSLGVEVGFASRIVYVVDMNGVYEAKEQRKIIGVGLPKMMIDFDRVMLNIGYVPPVSQYITEVIYLTVGIKI